jgi:hypothetical protein
MRGKCYYMAHMISSKFVGLEVNHLYEKSTPDTFEIE